MAATKEIKRRIKSIKNTAKITKAMELVSAAKMKRAVAKTLSSRTYSTYAWAILESLKNAKTDDVHPLMKETKNENILILLVTSSRGLCGSYNTQIIRKVLAFRREHKDSNISFMVIGKKGENVLRRAGVNIVASFSEFTDAPGLAETKPVSSLIFSEFESGKYDSVYIAYTEYYSALRQDPKMIRLLPLGKKDLEHIITDLDSENSLDRKTGYTFEPPYNDIIPPLLKKMTDMQVYQMIIEGSASEHSARMVAMKNAKEAAGEIIEELSLTFNKARQAAITQEISEISAGMASVS